MYIYVTSITVLLIFYCNLCSSKFKLHAGFSVVTQIEELAGLYWFTALTANTALMCSKGVLTFSRSYWMFLSTLLCIFGLNM